MPFLLPNQEHQSTEGTSYDVIVKLGLYSGIEMHVFSQAILCDYAQ